MLQYLAGPHDEPVTWRDVEVLPIVALAVLLVLAVVRLHDLLAPVLSGEFAKALGIVVLLGLRKVLGLAAGTGADEDGATA